MSADKFQQEDLPKILEAIKSAKESGESARVQVDFAPNGGVLSIKTTKEKKYK